MFEFLVIVAAFATLLASLLYIRSMFIGKTRPNRVTWLMWSIAPFTASAAALTDGVTWAVVPVLMSGFSPFLIFVASFFNQRAYWRLSWFDYLFGVLSALSLALWYVTENPNVAIVFAIISDAAAATPTLVKAWHQPETESRWPFVVGAFAPLTSFLAAPVWTFSEVAFPAYLVAINLLLVFSASKKICFTLLHLPK
jgi:hypothetical protein